MYVFLNNILFLKTKVASPMLCVRGKGSIICTKERLSGEDELNELLNHVWP